MKIEFTHDIIAKKVWERLPEEERQLKMVTTSLQQRLEDFKKGNGSLLGLKELVAWEDFFPLLDGDASVKKFIEDSRREVRARQEKEKQINQRLRSRLNTIYIIAGTLLLLAVFFFFQARTISRQKAKIELDAQKATQLRTAFGADDRQYFIEEGTQKFQQGLFQEAIYDFALARFLSEGSDTAPASSWIDRSQKGLRAQQLFVVGKWKEADQLIRQISDSLHSPLALIKQIQNGKEIWQTVIAGKDLDEMEELDLAGRQLHAIPDEIGRMTALQSIYLDRNHLKTLPQTIGQLPNLTTLVLSDNKLDSLPATLGNLTQLEFLDLKYNNLISLPASFGQLRQLDRLELDHNQLDSLPAGFAQLSSLRSLILSNNQLDSLPDNFGALTTLTVVDLDSNQLRSLPQSFGQFTRLRTLYLGNNQLTELPASFGQLQRLEELHLENNRLKALPDSFGGLSALEDVFLNNNQLQELPLFNRLVNLRSVYLQNNALERLSEDFVNNLPNTLLFLDLSGNDLENETIALINQSLSGVNVIAD